MLSAFVRFLLNPFHIMLLLAVVTTMTWYIKNERLFRIFFGSAVLWFLIITTPFVPYAILYSLESRYLPVKIEQIQSEDEIHVIVLGAGYAYNENLPANSQLSKEMLTRLVEGVRVHLRLQNSILIVSGPYYHEIFSQADVARQAAIQMNVPDSTIKIQHEGKTTHDEAKVYYQKFYEGQKLVVVTSASHMHRALGEFKRLGVNAVPSPSSYRFKNEKGMPVSFIPSLSNIDAMKTGMFEYAALFRNCIRDL